MSHFVLWLQEVQLHRGARSRFRPLSKRYLETVMCEQNLSSSQLGGIAGQLHHYCYYSCAYMSGRGGGMTVYPAWITLLKLSIDSDQRCFGPWCTSLVSALQKPVRALKSVGYPSQGAESGSGTGTLCHTAAHNTAYSDQTSKYSLKKELQSCLLLCVHYPSNSSLFTHGAKNLRVLGEPDLRVWYPFSFLKLVLFHDWKHC